jgi:hypothetical protein
MKLTKRILQVDTATKGSKSRASSRRPKTPQPESAARVEEQGQEGDPPTQAKTTTRRTRKPSAEPEFEEKRVETIAVPVRRGRRAPTVEPEEPTVVPRVATKRGRKPTVEPERETEKIDKVAPAKRGRKAAEEAIVPPPVPVKRGVHKAAAPAPVGESETDEQPHPQVPVRRGRPPKTVVKGKNDDGGVVDSGAKRRMKARAADVEMACNDDNDDDPLDSIREEEAEPAAAAIPKSQGRKKATTPAVKEEVENEKLEQSAPTTTRGAKAKSTTLKTPAARARGTTRKTPATAPAAIQQGVDKENAPGSESSSGVDPEEPAKVKIRVSRTRKVVSGTAVPATATRSARVKQEAAEDAPESEVPRARVMRATRARTKT